MIEIVKAGSRKYVAGLFWQPASTERRAELLAEAKGKAEQLNAALGDSEPSYNAYAVLKGDEGVQIGVGGLDGNSKALGCPSLAASIAGSVPSSYWRGWFVLEDGVWVVAVVQGIVLAQGDFFGTADQAEDTWKYLDSLSYDWDESSIRTFSVEESHGELSWLLSGKPQAELQPLRRRLLPRGTFLFLGVVAVVVAVGFVGHAKWMEIQRERQEVIRQQKKLEDPESIEDMFPPAWAGAPQPGDVLEACMDDIESMPLRDVGWEVESMTCTAAGLAGVDVSVAWKRSDVGTFEYLPLGGELNPDNPDHISTSINLPLHSTPQSKDVGLLSRAAMGRVILEAARPFEANVSIKWADIPQRQIGKGASQKKVTAPWRAGAFLVTGIKMRPDLFVHKVSNYSGIVVKSIKITPKGRWVGWEISGSVYVQAG